MAMRLDVGCGGYPTGDVNCDLARTKDWFKGDVICDCHHLPFIDRSFDEVYSSHTIEHVSSPYKNAVRVREGSIQESYDSMPDNMALVTKKTNSSVDIWAFMVHFRWLSSKICLSQLQQVSADRSRPVPHNEVPRDHRRQRLGW